MFEPIGHKTAPMAVYEKIRRAILNGDLPAGTPLREGPIASEMAISRSPLREALSRLEDEGLVEKIPYRGTFVATVRPETVAEIASVRSLVEPYAVESALGQLRGENRDILLHAVERLREAAGSGDPAALIDAHLALHRIFYLYCGNDVLRELWLGWEPKLRLFFVADHSAFTDPSDVFEAHQEFIDAVLAGDVDGIRRTVVRHLHSAPGAGVTEPG